jgi:hypothetical protein
VSIFHIKYVARRNMTITNDTTTNATALGTAEQETVREAAATPESSHEHQSVTKRVQQPPPHKPAPPEAVDSLAVATLAALVSGGKLDATSAPALANTSGAVEVLLQIVSTTHRDTDPKVAAALRALKAIADTSHHVLLHRHGAVAVLLGWLNRERANYDPWHNMETVKGGMDLLRNLWRTGAPTSQAQCLEAVTMLTPWVKVGEGNRWIIHDDSLRVSAIEMVADVVLTPEDALAREQHRVASSTALPPLSPDSVARIAAMGDVTALFKARLWALGGTGALARLLRCLMPTTGAQCQVQFRFHNGGIY